MQYQAAANLAFQLSASDWLVVVASSMQPILTRACWYVQRLGCMKEVTQAHTLGPVARFFDVNPHIHQVMCNDSYHSLAKPEVART